MEPETKQVFIVCLFIAIVFCFGIQAHTTRIKMFVENGYTRQAVIGSSETQWVKN